MKYRKLRFTWSVACGVACLLLIVLWVRSYTRIDSIYGRYLPQRAFGANSIFGRVQLYESPMSVPVRPDVIVQSVLLTNQEQQGDKSLDLSHRPSRLHALGFYFGHTPYTIELIIPDWFLVVSAGALAAIPWIKFRFSLRTLLIAMTVAAIGLGWLIYTLRK